MLFVYFGMARPKQEKAKKPAVDKTTVNSLILPKQTHRKAAQADTLQKDVFALATTAMTKEDEKDLPSKRRSSSNNFIEKYMADMRRIPILKPEEVSRLSVILQTALKWSAELGDEFGQAEIQLDALEMDAQADDAEEDRAEDVVAEEELEKTPGKLTKREATLMELRAELLDEAPDAEPRKLLYRDLKAMQEKLRDMQTSLQERLKAGKALPVKTHEALDKELETASRQFKLVYQTMQESLTDEALIALPERLEKKRLALRENLKDTTLTVQQHKLLDKELQKINQAITGNLFEEAQSAYHLLWTSNLRLASSEAAKAYYKRAQAVPLLDLIQEANAALRRAALKFDPALGYKFSTYASWWIKQAINRSMDQSAHAVRLPVGLCEKRLKLNQVTERLTQRLERAPMEEELAEAMGFSNVNVLQKLQAALERGKVVSLDVPVKESDVDSMNRYAVIANDNAEMPDMELEQCENGDLVKKLLSGLTPKEADILRKRFGLTDDGEELTLKEIGNGYGVSRERIRQLQEEALAKLRKTVKTEMANQLRQLDKK